MISPTSLRSATSALLATCKKPNRIVPQLRSMSTSPAPSSNPKDHAPNQPSNTQYRSNAQTQGSVSDDKTNLSKRDTQSQPAKGARKVKEKGSGSPMDTASAEHGTKQRRSEGGSGNPEGVGFVDQVGSASGTANKFEGKD